MGFIWASAVFSSRTPLGVMFELSLQGKIDGLSKEGLSVLGVKIDTSGGTFYDKFHQKITEAEFIAKLSLGDSLSIYGAASYNSDTHTLSGGLFTLLNHSSGNNQNRAANLPSGVIEITGSGQ